MRGVPAGLALFWRLSVQQRRNTRPLVFAVLHDGHLEDFILRVLPHAALDDDSHADCERDERGIESEQPRPHPVDRFSARF